VTVRILLLALSLLVAGCQSGPEQGSVSAGALPLEYREQDITRDPRFASIVVDAERGTILSAQNETALRYPASLTKMMTAYVLFEELEAGRLRGDTPFAVSANAAAQPPSKLGVRAGSTISVSDAIAAIAVKSANDVAVVIAENIAGSEARFAQRMTQTARSIGMRSTYFANASGLPDSAQVTTAQDIAILARALQRRFPSYYANFSRPSFSYAGKRYENTNKLLGDVQGMDFGKTGYTRASGYNLATSVRRNGRRVIVVVLGAPSGAARNAHVAALVNEYAPARSAWLSWRN